MSFKIFNTFSRKKETFKPIKEGHVGIYTCGPTVYHFAHIGNFRAYICSDILKRYLKYKNYKVKHVMNITDVDDKTIKGSIEQNLSLKEFTDKYTKFFFEDLKILNIDTPDVFPKATEHVDEMVEIIEKLLKNDTAYKSEDNSIYFNISSFKNYGKLAQLNLTDLKAGARVSQDEYDKEQLNDFALWKSYTEDDGDVKWKTSIGTGRPGWHIECSAMSLKHLGETFDIHAGGIDLIFPHHENEIAQSEASTKKKFVNYWFHNDHLLVEGKKMSKSEGNFFTLRDLIKKGYNPLAIRYLLFSSNYRQQLNFTEKGIEAAQSSIDRLNDFILKIKRIKNKEGDNIEPIISKTKEQFDKSMDDDLNISEALSHLFDFVKDINILIDNDKISNKDSDKIIEFLTEINSIINVLNFKEDKIESDIKKLVDEREKARNDKDFSKADKIRDQLLDKGYTLEDSEDGVIVKKK